MRLHSYTNITTKSSIQCLSKKKKTSFYQEVIIQFFIKSIQSIIDQFFILFHFVNNYYSTYKWPKLLKCFNLPELYKLDVHLRSFFKNILDSL